MGLKLEPEEGNSAKYQTKEAESTSQNNDTNKTVAGL